NPGYGFVDEQTPELSIAIVPSRRGSGLGSELLDTLLERARTEGYHAISLSVEQGSPAIGLYERHGFRQVGEDDGGVTTRCDPDPVVAYSDTPGVIPVLDSSRPVGPGVFAPHGVVVRDGRPDGSGAGRDGRDSGGLNLYRGGKIKGGPE